MNNILSTAEAQETFFAALRVILFLVGCGLVSAWLFKRAGKRWVLGLFVGLLLNGLGIMIAFALFAQRWMDERQAERRAPQPDKGASCYLCAVGLKPRAYFAGRKVGGGMMMGSELEKILEETMAAAYRCRTCGNLRCRACAETGPPCACGSRIFDLA